MTSEIRGLLKSKELEERIAELILKEKLQSGEPILSENKLAERYKVSRITVRRAISELVSKNVLFTEKGKGTFVTNRHNLKKKNTEPLLTRTIGLIVPTINNSYSSDIARGAEDVANEEKYYVIFCNSDGRLKKEEEYVRRLTGKKIDGFVILATSPASTYWRGLIRSKVPFVIVNLIVNGIDADYVITDDVGGSYNAVKHLINLGHKRIGHIRGTRNTSTGDGRMEGYRKAISDSGLEFDENLIQGNNFSKSKYGYLAMEKFLKMSQRPTAIFAANDILASGAYDAIINAGLRVPEDIALVGYADLRESARMDVPLTTVHQPGYEMGKAACERLIEKIKNKKHGDIKKIVFKTELIIRRSCGSNKIKKA
ncbi:GntR family transcriptional regulator [bacterium]|nr:GntR family transcriptional regulator [bacterium]